MAPIDVHIKHSGKTYNVKLDPDLPPGVFKDSIYQVTGIPVERMKVMVKGGVLKDDTPWKKIGPKAGQTFMVIGTAGELPKPPEQPIVFLEDMGDEELANALVKPAGLKNLGNTCYMNSTIQTLRAIPELQVALNPPTAISGGPLPPSLRDLYAQMGRTTEAVVPYAFLNTLRQVNPQFAEQDRRGGSGMSRGYAQQDAEECYSQILNSLRTVDVPAGTAGQTTGKFIEQYLMGQVRRELKNTESEEEPPTVTTERVMKIECNISITTNYMTTGIANAMTSTLQKNSPLLGREATYTQTSQMTRLPAYLTVQMVRFAWRADVGKKAKIMRKVKFPLEYDALDIASEDLKTKLIPASRRLKEIVKERSERQKIRKRTKKRVEVPDASVGYTPGSDLMRNIAGTIEEAIPEAAQAAADREVDRLADELLDEEVYRVKEREELSALVPEDVKGDLGTSWSGLYELVAIITHKGAAADSGHYIGFVKKSVFKSTTPAAAASSSSAPADGDVTMSDASATTAPAPDATASINPNLNGPLADESDEDWFKFDDDKVSIFPQEKLATLDGGGEDSSAYVLLYRTKSF